jgi:hypothetical protein
MTRAWKILRGAADAARAEVAGFGRARAGGRDGVGIWVTDPAKAELMAERLRRHGHEVEVRHGEYGTSGVVLMEPT